MATKLKSMLKKHSLQRLQAEVKSSTIGSQKMVTSTHNLYRTISVDDPENESMLRSGKKLDRRRIRSVEVGPIEDILQCTICAGRLKSPRMLPCQHTFCLECLKNEFPVGEEPYIKCPVCQLTVDATPESLPTNLYIETLIKVMESSKQEQNGERNPMVRFAPVAEGLKTDEGSKCHACKIHCLGDTKCRHCERFFCNDCWMNHTNELKDQLRSMSDLLCKTVGKFDGKINDFRNKIVEMKDLVRKDTEQRMAELMQKQEERLRRTEEMAAAGETSAEDIGQRLQKVRKELEAQMKEYDCLAHESEKVKRFLELEERVTELITTMSNWERDVLGTESSFEDAKPRSESTKSSSDSALLYKHKVFTEKTIMTRDAVQRPSGLALDPWRDQLVVTCPGSGQVVVLDRKFKLLKRIYHQDMMAPQGVVFLDEPSEIYVTDKWKHCIFVFSRKGELLRRICSKGSGEAQLRSPEGIAFHAGRNCLYIADTGNDRIQILKRDGTHQGSIGLSDKAAGSAALRKNGKSPQLALMQLNQPTDVAVSASFVVVADCGNHKVKVFSLEGQILRSIGGLGTFSGFFKSPQAVCVDQKGNIVVGDTGNGRIQIFSSEGELLRVVGGRGNKTISFEWISGVLVKNNYDILVADSKNSSISLL